MYFNLLLEACWNWKSIDEKCVLDVVPKNWHRFFDKYDFCLTGDGLVYLVENEPKFFSKLLPHVKVFARVAPKQKVKLKIKAVILY